MTMIAEDNIPYKMSSTMADKFNNKNRLQFSSMYKTHIIAKTKTKTKKKNEMMVFNVELDDVIREK